MKRILSLFLALALVCGCAAGAAAESTTLTWWFKGPGWAVDDGVQSDLVSKEIERQTGITLDLYASEDEALLASLMASGDLPDIMNVTVEQYNNLMNAGFLMPLDDLLKNAPNIQQWTDMLGSAHRRFTGSDGKLYAIEGYLSDPAATQVSGYPYGLTLRWDYYAEMGYPEVKTYKDYLNVIKDMVARYPTNEAGEKRYGLSMFSDWGWMVFFEVLATNINTLEGIPTTSIHGNVSTNGGWLEYYLDSEKMVDIISTEDSGLWKSVDFLYQAYNMGLLDPDSWTNTYDAVYQKCTADRVLSDIWNWNYSGINTALAKDESADGKGTGKGYQQLLSTSGQQYVFYGQRQSGVTGYSQRVVVVTTACDNPEAAMRFYDFLYSYDGGRLLASGIRDVHYVEKDGKLMVPASVDEAKKADTNWSQTTGIGKYGNSMGLSGQIFDPASGQLLGLTHEEDHELKTVYTQVARDWLDHYGFTYPTDFGNTIKLDGTIRSDYVANLAQMPDEISEIDKNINDYLGVELPNMVRLTSDEEFAAKKAEVIQGCYDLGLQKSYDWHMQQWVDSIALCNAPAAD